MPPRKKKEPAKPPAKKRGARPKYNYELAQRYFVEGMPTDPDDPDGDRDWPNLRVISERTDIPYERIREASAKDRWTDLKRASQQASAVERQKARMEKMGKQSIEFDERGLDIAKLGMQLIGVRMGEIAKLVGLNKELRKDAEERYARGESVERSELWSVVRADEMERLAKAAATLQDIGRKALGTDIERIEIDSTVTAEIAISVSAELERDDPDRLAAFFAAADRAGLMDQLAAIESHTTDTDDDVVDGELVEEGEAS